MISFETFAMEGGSPIYLQIVDYIKRRIAAGTIANQDVMPSRRTLSALLGVNPNTIQKAYRQLEEEALIASQTGAKSYVVINEDVTARIRAELMERDVHSMIRAMKKSGFSKDEALLLVENVWEETL